MPKTTKPKDESATRKPPEEVLGVEYLEAQNVPTYYVNNARISTSVWDMRIEMGQIKGIDPQTRKITVNPNVTILMTWTHARQMLRIMEKMVKQYEDTFGELPAVESLEPSKQS